MMKILTVLSFLWMLASLGSAAEQVAAVHTRASEVQPEARQKMDWLHMEVCSACLDGEMKVLVLHVRLTNTSHQDEVIPLVYGPLLRRSYSGDSSNEEVEEKYVRFSSAFSRPHFLWAQHFRVSGSSHLLSLSAEPDNVNRVGMASARFAPLETKCLVLRFRVLDVRSAGDERFCLRLIHEDPSLNQCLSYQEAEFPLQVTPGAYSRFQERKAHAAAASGAPPLSLSLQSAAMEYNVDGLLLHVRLKNHSEKPVRIGAGFRFKCMANEEDVALVLAEDEGGMRRGDMELAPGEVEDIIVRYDISKVKRTGKSAWKLRPSEPICNDLPFEITLHPPYEGCYGDIGRLDIRKEETSEDEFVLPTPPTVDNFSPL